MITAPRLDHLVLAAPDLAGVVAWFADTTGVPPARGGSHVGLGTANFLVGLGGSAYLELIGPDPDQPEPGAPRPFGIDELDRPRIVTWAVATPDLDAAVAAARGAGYDPGDPAAMSRRTPQGELLEWRLTPARAADEGGADGLVPFLIDWGSTTHPTSRALPEVPLGEFRGVHPDPPAVRRALSALRVELGVQPGEQVALQVTVDGRHGPVEL